MVAGRTPVQRGEIWWAALPSPRGSEPGFRRPVLVVQANPFNRSAIRTVIAATITSNRRLARAPGNVALSRRDSGLAKASVVNISQLVTLDREFLVDRVRELTHPRMSEVEDGIRLVLGL